MANDKAKYATFLQSPTWNEAVFSPEGYLVTVTNLDPKNEKSFVHKQKEILLDLAWITSPEPGTILTGTRSGTDLVQIKFLAKTDDGWKVQEAPTKEAEEKYKANGLIAIHVTEDQSPQLYAISEKLSQYKIVVDVGAGLGVNLEQTFDKEAFGSAFDKLMTFLLADKSRLYDDFETEDKEAYKYLFSIGCELSPVTTNTLRRGRWVIPGVDDIPVWTEITYTKPESVGKAQSGSNRDRPKYVTPQEKVKMMTDLLIGAESPLIALRAASEGLGYTITPQEALSLVVAAVTGASLSFNGPITAPTPTVDTDAVYKSLIEKLKKHPKWDVKSIPLKKLLAEQYEIAPTQYLDLTASSLEQLLQDLDTL